MCQHLDILVSSDERHYVAKCEHGILHLVWSRAVFQFYPTEFMRITRALEQWSTNATPDITCECVRLSQQPSGCIQLWLCGFGLNLTLMDAHALMLLLYTAALQLDNPQAAESQLQPKITDYPELRTVGRGTLFEN